MPTEATPELGALEAEFMKAEEALRKARDAFEQRNTRKTRADLAVASKEYDDAGRAVRRAADPERPRPRRVHAQYLRKRQQAKTGGGRR